MRAMILAAGRGERMRPLTDTRPKPLLEAGGQLLIEYHLLRLAAAGFQEVVINLGHLGHLIPARLGDGSRYGLRIDYSPEPPGALETGGGIQHALGLLGEAPFLLINGDIWSEHPLATLRTALAAGDLAHVVLAPNPPYKPQGDFALLGGRVRDDLDPRLTYCGLGVIDPRLFVGHGPGRYPLAPLLTSAMAEDAVSGELHQGDWRDIGTPARLAALNDLLVERNGPAVSG